MHAPSEKHFEFLCTAHETAIELSRRLRFDKTHPWHRELILLYGYVLELTGSACVLIRNNVSIAVPILLRSVVEANLDLVNLYSDRSYGNHLHASELKEWIKVLKEAKQTENPFLSHLHACSQVGGTLAELESELKELKDKGYPPLRPEEKFDKAGSQEVYKSVYNKLCCHSHANLRALQSHHLTIASDGGDFSINLYPPVDFDVILPYIDSFCSILVRATEVIHDAMRSDASLDIKGLREKLKEHRKEITTDYDAAQDGESAGATSPHVS